MRKVARNLGDTRRLVRFVVSDRTPVIHKEVCTCRSRNTRSPLPPTTNTNAAKRTVAVVALDHAAKDWTCTRWRRKTSGDAATANLYGSLRRAHLEFSAIDEKRACSIRHREATSEPAHQNTDAIIAVDMKDGSIRWSFQATANDIFLAGCGRGSKGLNCPKGPTVSRDVDFGASMMLVNNVNGKDLVIGGQKSGEVWALDRDTGKVVWRQSLSKLAPRRHSLGLAFDGERI